MSDDQFEFHVSERRGVIGWAHISIIPPNHPLSKMYTCYGQYHSSGFWKRLWLRLKIWHYRRLVRNDR